MVLMPSLLEQLCLAYDFIALFIFVLANIMHESTTNMFLQLKTGCLFYLVCGSLKEVVQAITLSFACRTVPSNHL